MSLYESGIRFAALRESYLQRGRNKDDKNLILARGMQALFCPGYTHFILCLYNKSGWLLPFRCPLAARVNEFMRDLSIYV
jgi:hypothetical protein